MITQIIIIIMVMTTYDSVDMFIVMYLCVYMYVCIYIYIYIYMFVLTIGVLKIRAHSIYVVYCFATEQSMYIYIYINSYE